MEMKKQDFDLEERLLEYSVSIIKIIEQLPKTRVGNHIAEQLLRSGISPYPSHGDVMAADSKKDYVQLQQVSLGQLRETLRWLKLIQRLPLISNVEKPNDAIQETRELIKIFENSIKTAPRRR